MNKKASSEPSQSAALRRKAEDRLRKRKAHLSEAASEGDVRALVHELQVHQIELEMQNEELQRAQAEALELSEKYYDLFDFAPVGYFLWDHEGRILEVNLVGATLLGLNRSVASRKRFGQFVAAEYLGPFADFLKQVLATDTMHTCEIRLQRDNSLVSVQIEGLATEDHQGKQRLCRAAVIDITQQKRANELAAANEALQAEIAARKQAEASLQEAKGAAEAASEAKSQFLANISHELRTPMNAILGMVDLALPKQVDSIAKDCLQTASESAKLLLALLNDLLDSAKIESGKLELELAAFNLHQLLHQITRVLALRASEKGITFSCDIPPELPIALVGDHVRLRQVLLNLAENAIKFTERGEVAVSVRVESQSDEATNLEFAVRDTGIGIARSELERIFDPFAQADASTTRRFGGTGLGLSITSSLVRMMGGRIWVVSEPEQGSTFYFTVRLPLATQHLPEPKTPFVITTAAQHLRILLVEDNVANQKLVFYLLHKRGHTVDIAGNGIDGVRLAEKTHYDAILMDVQMPGMNGLEATAAIRKREIGGRRVPIIATTAHAMKSDRDRCFAAGMESYLTKPINAQEMIGLIESLACSSIPVVEAIAATTNPTETSSQLTAIVFDPEEANKRCFNDKGLLREMIQYFFDEVDNLFPQMRAALEKGDIVEVSRHGHRLKGTIAYLGAQQALRAALSVEQLCKTSGTPSEAEDAVKLLEHVCLMLKAALSEHPLAAEPKQNN